MNTKHAETSANLWSMAREYLLAAQTLIRADRRAVLGFASHPTLYLLAHGSELGLKAYLRSHGLQARELKRLGHDLWKCLTEAEGKGLRCLGKKERTVLRWINEYYSRKDFEYVVAQGSKSLPHVRALEQTLVKLLNGVQKRCFEATVAERKQR